LVYLGSTTIVAAGDMETGNTLMMDMQVIIMDDFKANHRDAELINQQDNLLQKNIKIRMRSTVYGSSP
jgi:hypothetical protein